MKTELYETIDSAKSADGTLVEVLQFPELSGSSDLKTAFDLLVAKKSGIRLKMIRITLNRSSVRLEPGSLYFMQGDLQMKTTTGGNLMRSLSRKMLSGEKMFMNEIEGSGVIYLEPSFGHYILMDMANCDAGIIVDDGLFFAGTRGTEVSAVHQKNISSALFGGEGIFQTRITGNGVVVLNCPVPFEEIQQLQLNNEKLSVDGNFAILRSENIKFAAEKSSKTWFGTAASGEGLLQTFSGTGFVWIAPTLKVYEKLKSPPVVASQTLSS